MRRRKPRWQYQTYSWISRSNLFRRAPEELPGRAETAPAPPGDTAARATSHARAARDPRRRRLRTRRRRGTLPDESANAAHTSPISFSQSVVFRYCPRDVVVKTTSRSAHSSAGWSARAAEPTTIIIRTSGRPRRPVQEPAFQVVQRPDLAMTGRPASRSIHVSPVSECPNARPRPPGRRVQSLTERPSTSGGTIAASLLSNPGPLGDQMLLSNKTGALLAPWTGAA